MNGERESRTERIRGTVLRLTYHNAENDYRVVKLEPLEKVEPDKLDKRKEVVLVGSLPGIEVGECIEAEGRWAIHPRHGPQFKADWFKPSLPSGARGIEAYLASGALKGIGPVLARRIVAEFGEKTFEILDRDVEQLRRVKGITRIRFESLKRAWTQSRGDRELTTFLGDHGIAPSWAARLRRAYGDSALSIVRSNPYRLAAEVRGIGFHRADAIARQLGVGRDSPERIESALVHVLESQAEEGHTFLPEESLIQLATDLLALDQVRVEQRLDEMIAQKKLIQEEIGDATAVFLPTLHEAETQCALHLRRILAAKRRLPQINLEESLETFQRRFKFQLSETQHEAALTLAREGMMVLTGGPGTGKTTTLRAIIKLFQEGRLTVKLAAPTGRAARRLSETSRMQAETIHRLLGFQAHTGRFSHDGRKPLEADLVIIDESSMLDVVLASDLFRAIGNGTCLLLVGDEDQLPPVGPGCVLRDVLASEIMPVARLTEIFRQAQSSLIVVNAHRINRGEAPLLESPRGMESPDFFFIERKEPDAILETIKTLVAERIPRKYGFNPQRDVQILTPMRRGELGVRTLNRELQKILNPPKMQEKSPSDSVLVEAADSTDEDDTMQTLRVGDRVMQMANNYDKDVFNGDIGRVNFLDAESGEILVDFEGRTVSYLADETQQLTLAYAVTIHKSQGSEYRAVVIPLHTRHYVMLQRNLLYTALTRARELACIVGSKQALWKAVRDVARSRRNSALETYLRKNIEVS